MRAYLIAVGERMPAWVQQGYAEYGKRLAHELPLQLVEVSTKSRRADPARASADEGDALLGAIPKGAHVIALDGRGKPWSSEDLAAQLGRWRMLGRISRS
jgi:23S rRNA (pseudouridine1915-N3)-methyltransferase